MRLCCQTSSSVCKQTSSVLRSSSTFLMRNAVYRCLYPSAEGRAQQKEPHVDASCGFLDQEGNVESIAVFSFVKNQDLSPLFPGAFPQSPIGQLQASQDAASGGSTLDPEEMRSLAPVPSSTINDEVVSQSRFQRQSLKLVHSPAIVLALRSHGPSRRTRACCQTSTTVRFRTLAPYRLLPGSPNDGRPTC
eukprot:767756-Hanusia_phi.AAC.4